ncbi:MAG: hypothetical protein PUC28_13650 [Blautia sp.]|nr:hypothetical protein [Blautia sp.]
MAEISNEIGDICRDVKKIIKDHKGIDEAFSQYLAHERFILESAMDEEEERKSRNAFAGAYSRELGEFEELLEDEIRRRGLIDPNAKRQILEEMGLWETIEDYHAFVDSSKENDPLNELSREQQAGVQDFHRWLYRNCDKSGYAYMGSKGSVREYADSFMKKNGKDQLRALYILENDLNDAPDAVEQADGALENYVPDLKAIKNQMIRSKFRVLARTDGTQFKWHRLSGALNMVEEANQEKEFQENSPQIGLESLAAETGIPQKSLGKYAEAVGNMYRDMSGLNRILMQGSLQEPMPGPIHGPVQGFIQPAFHGASTMDIPTDYLEARNRQIAMVNRSSRDVLRTVKSDPSLEKALDSIENVSDMTDAFLNMYYAYSVAGQAHQAAKGIRMGIKNADDLQSVYSSLFGALGGEDERLLTVSEGAMDLGLGVLTAVSSGAAMVTDARELINNFDVVRKTENLRRTVQVGQDFSYAAGGGASAAEAAGNILGFAADTIKTAKNVSSTMDLAAGAADMVMGVMDVYAGISQRKRSQKAKDTAAKLKDVVKKAEIRGAAKTAKKRNKWKGWQGVFTALKGALCVAGGVLTLALGAPAVGAAFAAAGTAGLVAQIYGSKQKERITNNRKTIDAQILAKDREIERGGNERPAGEKKTRAIEDKVQEHKKLLEIKKSQYKEGSRQRKFLDQLLTDDKRIKHVIRTGAAVRMGCMTQEECRQKLDMQTVEKAFRHVYLKDPDGDFADSNIITKETAEQYFNSKDAGQGTVERIAYRDILKSHGFKVKHESKADGKKMEERLEKVKSSMEK